MNEKTQKQEVADIIRQQIGSLQQSIELAQKLGLEVEIGISKFAPREPITVSVFEVATF